MYESKNVYISPSEKRKESTRDFYQMEFAKDLFSMLYPLKTVKRFIYRPMLGRWYPHIDVDLLGYDMQLGFFFDEVGVSFSKARFCCKCGAKLSEERPLNSFIPISLCSDCNIKIFYEYWDCLNSLYYSNSLCSNDFSNKKDKKDNKDNKDNTNKNVQKSVCDDFLKPRCGYPLDGEYINPCLKNHGIGLLLVNKSELKIIIGLVETLKYQMIWQGGLFGVILGFTDRIMNLEKIRDFLPKFYLKTSEAMINTSVNGSDKRQEKTESLQLNATLKPMDISSIFISFLVNLLDYYPNFLTQHFVSGYFVRPFEFLKGLLRKVILELNLEIIDFIELYKAYPPIHFELRSVLEQQIKKEFDIKEINQLTLSHLSKLMSFETNVLNNLIDPDIINLNDLVGEFEIYHILWSIGPYIFSKTSTSHNISVINLYDLLGRRIS